MSDFENGISTYMIYGFAPGFRADLFNAYVEDSVDILSFWNHLPLLYFVKTRLTADGLTRKIRPHFETGNFIVAEVNPSNVNGWMSAEAWPWFTQPAPTVKEPSPNFGTLAAILSKRF